MSEQTTSTDPADKVAASKSHARQAAEELRDAATQKADELKDAARERAGNIHEYATDKAHDARDYAEEQYSRARVAADDYRQDGERYVRENPAKSVLIALGIGFIVGRVLR